MFSSAPRKTGVPPLPQYGESPVTPDRSSVHRTPQLLLAAPSPLARAVSEETNGGTILQSRRRALSVEGSTSSSGSLVQRRPTETGGVPGEKWRGREDPRTKADLEELRQRAARLEEENKALQGERKSNRETMSSLSSALDAINAKLKDMDDFKKKSEEEQQAQGQSISNLNNSVTELQRQLQQVTAERDKAQEEVKLLRQQYEDMQAEMDSLKADGAVKSTQIAQLQTNLVESERQRKAMETIASDRQNTINALMQQQRDANGDAAEISRMQQLVNKTQADLEEVKKRYVDEAAARTHEKSRSEARIQEAEAQSQAVHTKYLAALEEAKRLQDKGGSSNAAGATERTAEETRRKDIAAAAAAARIHAARGGIRGSDPTNPLGGGAMEVDDEHSLANAKAVADAEAQRRAAADTEARTKAAAEARTKAAAEAEAQRRAAADTEARTKAAAEAEARTKAVADAEAQRRAAADAEARTKAAAEARAKAAAEAEAQRRAAAAAKDGDQDRPETSSPAFEPSDSDEDENAEGSAGVGDAESRPATMKEVKDRLRQLFKKFATLVEKNVNILSGGQDPAQRPRNFQAGSRNFHLQTVRDRFAKVPKKEQDLMTTHVRKMFLTLVGRKHLDDFFTYKTANPEDVAAVDSGAAIFPKGTRTLHFGPKHMSSKWNRCCIEGMADYLLENGVNDWSGALPDLQHNVLVSLLWSWVSQAQKNWKSALPRVDSVSGEVETPEEALRRALSAKEHHKKSCKARQRKQTKHNKRILTTERQMAMHLPDSAEYRMWKHRKELTEQLGVNGMSSEDEEPRTIGTTTKMVRMVSRHRFLSRQTTREMHAIDGVAKTATHSTPRIYTDKVSQNLKTQVPVGLANDCYNQEWLASLLPGALQDLKVKEGPHPLVQPSEAAP